MDRYAQYARARDRLAAEVSSARIRGQIVGLRKSSSNLFRSRDEQNKHRLDVSDLCHVLRVDTERMTADVEGMTTYETLVAETLGYGLLPVVTPELKTITAGGAVSGLGIESSSFRFGLVHQTVEDMDVLLGDGSVVQCSGRKNADVFYCLPNSYATLGYILRLSVRLMPARPVVRLTHDTYTNAGACFRAMASAAEDPSVDFLDGTVFGPAHLCLTTGRMQDDAPYLSNYRYRSVYYKSIAAKRADYLSIADYVWRWDTDWFWCSKQFHLQNPAIRCLASPWFLNSRTYGRLMRLSRKLMPASTRTESVIQDVAVPIGHAEEFLDFLLSEIRITPVWLCPFRSPPAGTAYPLYSLQAGKLYINFGFWDVLPARGEPGYYNRLVERAAQVLEGRKALYSASFYDPATFRALYDHDRYAAVKSQCDPAGVLGDLYGKCIQGK